MTDQVKYTDEPIGKVEITTDFLPSPEELALKNQNTKVTLALSAGSVEYFKKAAKKNDMPYQKMIRELLDDYVAHQTDR